jgi:putative peptide zinc metalloprotease protein
LKQYGQLVAEFLKETNSPFAPLDPEPLLRLASQLKPLAVPAGATIVRQGEPGEEEVCYLLGDGSAEVLISQEDTDEERLQGTLEPGALFGEGALLTEEPHNLTVRALEPCELLVVKRDDLLEAMRADGRVAARIRELLELRHLPRQVPGILAYPRTTPEGEKVTTLKDPQRGTYFRLSEGGFFVWERLDGRHTIRELMLEYLEEFGSFAPKTITELVGGLMEEGFVESPKLTDETYESIHRITRWQRATAAAHRILEWRAVLRGVDAPLTRLYAGGVWLLYTRVAQLILAALTLAGLVAFVLGIGDLGNALEETEAGGWLLLFWIPATLGAILIHEAGHAFTTKAYGREVPNVGVGWYWFGPIAYVDTTDMWLEGRRWPKIAVSLAGPYADLALGGIAALGAFFCPEPILAAFLWQFALVSYIGVLINFNPLMEFDGYYVLIDLLNRPNLRPEALSWLGRELIPALKRPERLKEHKLELLYGVGSVLYIASMGVITVVLYRLIVEDWLAGILPGAVAASMAWVLAAAVVILASAGVLGELRRGRTPLAAR